MNSHYQQQMVEDEDQKWLNEMLRLARSPKRAKPKLAYDQAVIMAFVNGDKLDTFVDSDEEDLQFSHDQRVIRDFINGTGVFAQD